LKTILFDVVIDLVGMPVKISAVHFLQIQRTARISKTITKTNNMEEYYLQCKLPTITAEHSTAKL